VEVESGALRGYLSRSVTVELLGFRLQVLAKLIKGKRGHKQDHRYQEVCQIVGAEAFGKLAPTRCKGGLAEKGADDGQGKDNSEQGDPEMSAPLSNHRNGLHGALAVR
jgi:hypothetical protein